MQRNVHWISEYLYYSVSRTSFLMTSAPYDPLYSWIESARPDPWFGAKPLARRLRRFPQSPVIQLPLSLAETACAWRELLRCSRPEMQQNRGWFGASPKHLRRALWYASGLWRQLTNSLINIDNLRPTILSLKFERTPFVDLLPVRPTWSVRRLMLLLLWRWHRSPSLGACWTNRLCDVFPVYLLKRITIVQWPRHISCLSQQALAFNWRSLSALRNGICNVYHQEAGTESHWCAVLAVGRCEIFCMVSKLLQRLVIRLVISHILSNDLAYQQFVFRLYFWPSRRVLLYILHRNTMISLATFLNTGIKHSPKHSVFDFFSH